MRTTREAAIIQTRRLLLGNMVAHSCFDSLCGTDAYRVPGNLDNADRIMNDTFWVDVYPGLSDRDIERMISVISGVVTQIDHE